MDVAAARPARWPVLGARPPSITGQSRWRVPVASGGRGDAHGRHGRGHYRPRPGCLVRARTRARRRRGGGGGVGPPGGPPTSTKTAGRRVPRRRPGGGDSSCGGRRLVSCGLWGRSRRPRAACVCVRSCLSLFFLRGGTREGGTAPGSIHDRGNGGPSLVLATAGAGMWVVLATLAIAFLFVGAPTTCFSLLSF